MTMKTLKYLAAVLLAAVLRVLALGAAALSWFFDTTHPPSGHGGCSCNHHNDHNET